MTPVQTLTVAILAVSSCLLFVCTAVLHLRLRRAGARYSFRRSRGFAYLRTEYVKSCGALGIKPSAALLATHKLAAISVVISGLLFVILFVATG